MRRLVFGVVLACASHPASASPTELHLRYAIYVHGFHAMQANAAFRVDGGTYDVELEDHSIGLLGAFVASRTASHADGTVAGSTLQPRRFASAGFSRGANRQTVIDYAAGAPEVRVLSPVEPDRDRVAPQASRGAVDTLTAMATLLELVAQRHSCDGTLRVFDGARLSVLTSRTAGETVAPPTDRSPYAGPALRCDLSSLQIGGFLHNSDYARAHQAQSGSAWVAPVAPGGQYVPIRATFTTLDHGPVAVFLVSAS